MAVYFQGLFLALAERDDGGADDMSPSLTPFLSFLRPCPDWKVEFRFQKFPCNFSPFFAS
jgi:hypothetical protein